MYLSNTLVINGRSVYHPLTLTELVNGLLTSMVSGKLISAIKKNERKTSIWDIILTFLKNNAPKSISIETSTTHFFSIEVIVDIGFTASNKINL